MSPLRATGWSISAKKLIPVGDCVAVPGEHRGEQGKGGRSVAGAGGGQTRDGRDRPPDRAMWWRWCVAHYQKPFVSPPSMSINDP